MNVLKHVPANLVGRDFVVGDLHGCYDLLMQALEYQEFDKTKDRLFSVGDMIDRGPKSLECLELLLEPWFHAVMGNHEDLMLGYYENTPVGAWWGYNGGLWNENFSKSEQDRFKAVFGLVAELPIFMTVDMKDGKKFHIVHAELDVDLVLDDEMLADEEALVDIVSTPTMDGSATSIWGRVLFRPIVFKKVDTRTAIQARKDVDFYHLDKHFGLGMSTLYTGHTVLQQPTRITKQVDLDTGAFLVDAADENRAWAGLTLTEPATGKFWKTNKQGTQEVALVEV